MRSTRATLLLQSVAIVLSAGCRDPATRVLVEIESDLSAAQMDGFEVVVEGRLDPQARRTFLRSEHPGSKWSFMIAPVDDQLERPVTVVVRGLLAGRTVIQTRRRFERFLKGETFVLPIELSRACLEDTLCEGDTTCAACGCLPIAFSPNEEEDCATERPDGGMIDGGALEVGVDLGDPTDAGEDAGPTDLSLPDTGSPDSGAGEDSGPSQPWLAELQSSRTVYASAVATSSSSVVVVGRAWGDINVAGQTLPLGTDDSFVFSFDHQGSIQWMAALGGPGAQDVTDVAVSSDAKIYLAGAFTEALQYQRTNGEGGALVGDLVSSGFLITLDPNGDQPQLLRLQDASDVRINSVTAINDRAVIVGEASGDVLSALGCSRLNTSIALSNARAIAIAQSSEGCVWGTELKSSGMVNLEGVSANAAQDRLFVTGHYTETLNLPRATDETLFGGDPTQQAMVITLDAPEGYVRDFASLGHGPQNDFGTTSIWAPGQLLVTGSFRSSPFLVLGLGATIPVPITLNFKEYVVAVALNPSNLEYLWHTTATWTATTGAFWTEGGQWHTVPGNNAGQYELGGFHTRPFSLDINGSIQTYPHIESRDLSSVVIDGAAGMARSARVGGGPRIDQINDVAVAPVRRAIIKVGRHSGALAIGNFATTMPVNDGVDGFVHYAPIP